MKKTFEEIGTTNYRSFRHTECEFFPCHDTLNESNFNCLFCYCPLYNYDNCDGFCSFTKAGIKDCSNCLIPHVNYDHIIDKLFEFSQQQIQNCPRTANKKE